MNMAAALKTPLPMRSRRANSWTPSKGQGGRARLRPGPALVWLAALVGGAVFVALVSVALLYGFRWLTTSPYFALREITVSGNQRLGDEALRALAAVEPGANVLEVKIAEVEKRVAASPWVQSAAVRRVLPSGLAITVREREPRWWVRTTRGLFYAERDGAVIAPVLPDALTPLPVLDVGEGAGGLPVDLADMVRDFDSLGLPVRMAEAAWVRVLPGRLDVYFEKGGQRRGLWISAATDDWELSMERLGAVWADLARRGEDLGVREIRIFGGKVWVRS